MSDRRDPTDDPRDADELAAAVADLGQTDEDRLDAVRERNASLEDRLPGDEDLPRTKGARNRGRLTAPSPPGDWDASGRLCTFAG